jgi:hypothetical protein
MEYGTYQTAWVIFTRMRVVDRKTIQKFNFLFVLVHL